MFFRQNRKRQQALQRLAVFLLFVCIEITKTFFSPRPYTIIYIALNKDVKVQRQEM